MIRMLDGGLYFYALKTTNQELSRVESNKDKIKRTSWDGNVRETPHAAGNNIKSR